MRNKRRACPSDAFMCARMCGDLNTNMLVFNCQLPKPKIKFNATLNLSVSPVKKGQTLRVSVCVCEAYLW